jgi:helicase MOV-10
LQTSNQSALSEKLLPSSNLREKKSQFPTREELEHFPIIICTLVKSSQLDRASLQNYFDYIFIDECAATTEPDACIPILGLGCDEGKVTASIVLMGDPKQLPPVISSSVATKLGLNISLMERLMSTKKYKPKPNYNPNYIVQLLDNYRSHPSILHFSNVEFYESKLRAKNTSDEVMSGMNWKKLSNKQFPVLFHNEMCASKKEGKSSYNNGEINIVSSYVNNLIKSGLKNNKITAEDIGVVTPYKAQSEKLKKVLPKNVEVGTTEYFQGREKLIMIISTVKSKAGIGFLKDERRLNVCMTRAKALMIVVGNAETLQVLICYFVQKD